MSVATVKIAGVTVNAAGAVSGGVPVQAQLVLPVGVIPVDTAGERIDLTPLTTTSDVLTGAFAFDPAAVPTNGFIAPLDVRQYVAGVLTAVVGAYWQVTYLGTVITSPSFAYTASTIDPATWATAPSTLGLIKCYLGNVFGSGAAIVGRTFSVSLSGDAFWSGGLGTGQRVPGNTPFPLTTSATGAIYAYVIRQSELTPSTGAWVALDGTNGGSATWQAPATYGVNDAGVYNAGTTYAINKIVRRASDDEPFISLTNANVGNPLTDGVHWADFAGVNIESILTVVGPPGLVAITTAALGHDSNVPPFIDDPTQSPASLHDDLGNLAARIPGARRTITTSAAINAVTDDNVFANAAGGAIAPTLPLAANRTRKLSIIKTDAAAAVTITATGGNLINGAATLTLSTQYQWAVLESDGTNWYAQTGTGGAPATAGITTTMPPARIWRAAITPGTLTTATTATVVADSSYNAFPWVVASRSGTLIACFRAGSQHASLDGAVVLARSTDGGITWGGKVAIATPGSGIDFRDPSIVCTRTGRLLVTYNSSPDLITYTVYTLHSDDDGATWSIPALLSAFSSYSITTGAPLQHSGGTLLLPLYGENSGDTGQRSAVVISSDDGATWGSLLYIGGANTNYGEPTIIEVAGGAIQAYMRSLTNPDYPRMSLSTTAGVTWSAPAALSFQITPGRPTAITFPVSGEIIFLYRQTSTNAVAYRTSQDQSNTWSSEVVLDATGDTNGGMYAGGIGIGDALIALVYSVEVNSTRADIHFRTLATGIPTVSGSRQASPALASVLAGLAKQGQIIDTTTAGSGPAATFNWIPKSVSYTLSGSDQGVLFDCSGGALTATLPTAVGATQAYAINVSNTARGNTLTIATTGGQTIDGLGTITLRIPQACVVIASDGSNWFIVASYNTVTLVGELLVTDGSSGPPVTLYTEDGTDWLYADPTYAA